MSDIKIKVTGKELKSVSSITYDDILKVKKKLDAIDIPKRIIIEANNKTVDKLLQNFKKLKHNEVPGPLLCLMSSNTIIKNEIYPDHCVRIGNILYFLDTGTHINLGKPFEELMKDIPAMYTGNDPQ